MRDYEISTYGDRIAEVYDERTRALDPTDAVTTLARLARGGRVLELGIGTGRIALPLAERGVRIEGIDASEAMVAKLREKPGGRTISVRVGDFAEVAVEGTFSLVFVACARRDERHGLHEEASPLGAFEDREGRRACSKARASAASPRGARGRACRMDDGLLGRARSDTGDRRGVDPPQGAPRR
jgi:SAM-dependent methyltransferase